VATKRIGKFCTLFYSVNLKKFAKNLEEFAKVSKLPNWKKNISYG
jgi:hypothetical protein